MSRRLLWVLASTSVLGACAESPTDSPRSPSDGLGVAPLAVDARGMPRMLAATNAPAAPAARPLDSARIHVERLAPVWGVRPDAMPVLQEVAEVKAARGTIARFRQVIDGLPVADRELRVLVGDGGELMVASGTLVSADTPRSPAVFAEPDTGAVARAVAHTHGAVLADGGALVARRASADGTRFLAGRLGGVDVELARAQQVWQPTDGGLVAAWAIEAYTGRPDSTNSELYRTVIAAASGKVLSHVSLTQDIAFRYRVFAETAGELHPFDGPLVDASPHPSGVPDKSYPAFTTPNLVTVEGLNHPMGAAGPDPWLAANRTETLGNNVEAYADFNAPSGLTFGDFRATTTAAQTFDRVYDTALGPMVSQGQQMAAITSLFYNINWLHDFWYDAGFTEAAGNAQDNNFGRGGQDRDAILAEAQDNALGGSRNNANMSTPSDGLPPRMQVFLWTNDKRELAIQPANRKPDVGSVAWPPQQFDTTGAIALGVDGTAPVNDACEPLTNSVAGKIVLVDRGLCSAKTKTLNVQNAGGIGVIIANNVPGSAPNFSNDATITTPITIGTLTITQPEGTTIKGEIGAGAPTANLKRTIGAELDGSHDATLVAHEYGHYLHHRLNQCGSASCGSMSEGWGDFLALMVLIREGDNYDGVYPFSVYTTISFSNDPAYFGIRRAPFSVDPAVNALSFRHIRNGEALPTTHPFLVFGPNAEVHNAGEIWAEAMLEVYVALLKQQGAVFNEVRAKMAKIVVDGLQLMPVEPTWTEARDALVAAAPEGDRTVMLQAFARRGFGSCAVAPPIESASFVEAVESTVVAGRAVASGIGMSDAVLSCDEDGVLDKGETGTLTMTLSNTGHNALRDVKITPTTTTPGLVVAGTAIEIAELPVGGTETISVEVKLEDGLTAPIAGEIKLTVATPGACTETLDVTLPARLNTDDKPNASATDKFDAKSIWTPSNNAPLLVWEQKLESPLDSLWFGADVGTRSDTALVAPSVHVESGPFTVTFSHRYSFEFAGATNFDGGVIEVSSDGGATWADVSTFAGVTPNYGPMLDPSNPLGARPAYTRANPNNPGFDTVTLSFGTALANKDVMFRFRIGTDEAVGAPGWEIDDVAFTGITGTPFPELVGDQHSGACVVTPDQPPGQPGGDADGGCCSTSPLRASTFGLALGVLALVLRRRRRR